MLSQDVGSQLLVDVAVQPDDQPPRDRVGRGSAEGQGAEASRGLTVLIQCATVCFGAVSATRVGERVQQDTRGPVSAQGCGSADGLGPARGFAVDHDRVAGCACAGWA
ncbi:hypothetical protein AB0J43_04095 [Nonomuraea fuscirosea]